MNLQELFKWYQQFDNKTLLITTDTTAYPVKIYAAGLPHLLGLHYQYDDPSVRAHYIISDLTRNSFSLEEVYQNVKIYHSEMLNDVKKRIALFPDFMKHLEEGVIVENKMLDTYRVKSQNFVIQMKNGEYVHLGLKDTGKNLELETFSVMTEEALKDLQSAFRVLETFSSNPSDSRCREALPEKILRLEEVTKEGLRSFSFNEERFQIKTQERNQEEEIER